MVTENGKLMGGQRRQASNIDMHSVQIVNVCLGAQKFEV